MTKACLGLPAVVVGGLLMAACAGIDPAPQARAAEVAAAAAATEARRSIEPQGVPATTAAVTSPSLMAAGVAVVPAPVIPAAEPARPASPAVNRSATKLAVSPPPATMQAPPPSPPPPPRAQPAPPPPLDLKSLEARLKETKAIGVFTKLALKNQIDDLLERFRALYQGRIKTSMVELRRSFDMLVMKTLALLQDADAPLAFALASSRESIWGILSDPKKFATV